MRGHRFFSLSMLIAGMLLVGGLIAGCGGQTTTSTLGVTTTVLGVTTAPGATTTTTSGSLIPLQYTVQLSGSQVVPPVQTSAEGSLALGVGSSGITFKLEVQNLTGATGASIHLGAKGGTGAAVVDLPLGSTGSSIPSGAFSGTLAQGTITASDLIGPLAGKSILDLVAEFAHIGAGVYVEVDTTAHPQGEIRGDIVP